MDTVIIYQLEGEPVSILSPAVAATTKKQLVAVGKSEVPYKTPFWIVPLKDLPSETFRNCWDIDAELAGKPAGYGAEK